MIRAKHYETVSKFVKVMPKIPWPLLGSVTSKNVKWCHLNLMGLPRCMSEQRDVAFRFISVRFPSPKVSEELNSCLPGGATFSPVVHGLVSATIRSVTDGWTDTKTTS